MNSYIRPLFPVEQSTSDLGYSGQPFFLKLSLDFIAELSGGFIETTSTRRRVKVPSSSKSALLKNDFSPAGASCPSSVSALSKSSLFEK